MQIIFNVSKIHTLSVLLEKKLIPLDSGNWKDLYSELISNWHHDSVFASY